jgi:hypothetical protein
LTLILHSGASSVTYDELRERVIQMPEPTATHIPVPHHEIVELMRYTLGFYGHEIVEEHHGMTSDGYRYFGLLSLRSNYGNYTDTLGLRNSHDKSFPIGVAIGSRVMVCDNLSFYGENVIRRKHTIKAKRELPGLVSEIVAPLQAQRLAQNQTFQRYQQVALTDQQADHAILSMYRRNVIGVQRIADVIDQYERPTHDWGDRTAWRLFNAATFALSGRVSENPSITRNLHEVIDAVCEEVVHA